MQWYPRFTGDYMRDTAQLTLTEHGAYTVLLDHYYSTPDPLPVEYDALDRICRAYDEREKAAVKLIADKYFPIQKDGLRHNKRADIELAKAMDKTEKARRSAGVRWGCDGNANAMRTHMPTQCSPHPQPEPQPYPEPTPKPENQCLPSIDPQFLRCWESFGRYGVRKQALEYWRRIPQQDRDAIEACIPDYMACVAAGRTQMQFEGWINPRNRKWDMDWRKARQVVEAANDRGGGGLVSTLKKGEG